MYSCWWQGDCTAGGGVWTAEFIQNMEHGGLDGTIMSKVFLSMALCESLKWAYTPLSHQEQCISKQLVSIIYPAVKSPGHRIL